MRSFVRLMAIDPGFQADHVISVATNLPARSYPGQDAPLHSVGSWSYVLARPDLPEKTAYLLARAIHRAEAPLAARLPQASETTMTNTFKAAPSAELIHPGVLKYLREAGIPAARQ